MSKCTHNHWFYRLNSNMCIFIFITIPLFEMISMIFHLAMKSKS